LINFFPAAEEAADADERVHWSAAVGSGFARFDFKTRKTGKSRRSRSIYCRSRVSFCAPRATGEQISESAQNSLQ
jgi:hypothetical protein